mgnify:CR=1 FL=1
MLDLNRRSLIKGSVAAGVTALFGTPLRLPRKFLRSGTKPMTSS